MWHQGSNKVRSEPVLSLFFDVLMRMRNIFLPGWLEETLASSNFIIQMAMKCRWIGLPVTFSDAFISCYVVASVKMNQYLSSCFLRKKKKHDLNDMKKLKKEISYMIVSGAQCWLWARLSHPPALQTTALWGADNEKKVVLKTGLT